MRSVSGPDKCIIDARGGGCGVVFKTFERDVSVLDGFTVTGCTRQGAVYCQSSYPTIRNCHLIGNQTRGLHCNDHPQGRRIIENCLISGNSASGLVLDAAGSGDRKSYISNCIISGNSGGTGGGVDLINYAEAEFMNCLIADNTATIKGGAVYAISYSAGRFYNCSLVGNTAPTGGALYVEGGSDGLLHNCIVWGNASPGGSHIYLTTGIGEQTFEVYYSDIEGGVDSITAESLVGNTCILIWGTGNKNETPQFSEGGYELSETSPCVDAGDPATIALRRYEVMDDPNAIAPGPTDVSGDPRIIGESVDMGAYEYDFGMPVIQTDAASLTYIGVYGQTSATQQITVRNGGCGVLNWRIEPDSPWIIVEPDAGETGKTGVEVAVSVDFEVLPEGTYTGHLNMFADDALNSPHSVSIGINVSDGVAYVPGDYATIQAAVEAALDGHTVVIAPGVYTGEGNWDVLIKGKHITIRGQEPENEDIVRQTIVHCQGDTEDYHQGFVFEAPGCTLEGLTVRYGGPPHWYDYGSAVWSSRGLTINHCVFHGHNEEAVHIRTDVLDPPVVITGCHFEDNPQGLLCLAPQIRITQCTFVANGTWGAAGDDTRGGAAFIRGEEFEFSGCSFEGNFADSGGAIWAEMQSGAPEPRITFVNCLFAGNKKGLGTAGAVYLNKAGQMQFSNCTFAANSTPSIPKQTDMYNCIVWGQPGDAYAVWRATYSSFDTAVSGEGNIHGDPLFVSPGYWHSNTWVRGDYRLQFASPCIEAGTNMVPGGLQATDLAGMPRVIDGDLDGQGVVDMGVFESEASTSAVLYVWPKTCTFDYEPGWDIADTVLTVRNRGALPLTWTVQEDCDWLSLNAAPGDLAAGQAADILMSIDPQGLSRGTYATTLTVTDVSGHCADQSVQVNLAVRRPSILLGKSQIDFAALEAGQNPSAQLLSLRNTGDAVLEWEVLIADACEWLRVEPSWGILQPQQLVQLSISADVGGLTGGMYECDLEVHDPDATNSPQSVNVNFQVTGPVLEVSAASIQFSGKLDGLNPASQALIVTNAGGGMLEWTISGDAPCEWLSIAPASGSLAAGESAAANLAVDTGGLPAGTYGCDLTVDAPGSDGSQNVAVSLDVIGPTLVVSPSMLDFSILHGSANPDSQTLIIQNAGGGLLRWSLAVVAPCDWLSIDPVEGILSLDESCEVRLSVDTEGLLIDHPYTCTVEIGTAEGQQHSALALLLVGSESRLWVPYNRATIQAAIDGAAEGEVITVLPGRYRERIGFNGKNVVLRSASPEHSNSAMQTIIEGSDGQPTVTFSGSESTACQLSGLTIMGGFAGNGTEGACVDGNGTHATVRNCFFRGGESELNGGGIADCRGLIENCRVTQTSSQFGAIYRCSGTIRNCYVGGNTGSTYSAAFVECDARIEHCVIADNDTHAMRYCTGPILNCTITHNTGYAMYKCTGLIHNCIVWGNGASSFGSSTPRYSCYPNAIGAGNLASAPLFSESGYWDPGDTPDDPNDDIWVRTYHLKSAGGRWDPELHRWVCDDVTSPCVDAGDPASDWRGELWPHGGRINMGAYGGTREASMSLSAVGERADLDYDEAVGFGDFGVMAWEWGYGAANPPANPPHFRAGANLPYVGDLNRDGVVGLADLAILCERL